MGQGLLEQNVEGHRQIKAGGNRQVDGPQRGKILETDFGFLVQAHAMEGIAGDVRQGFNEMDFVRRRMAQILEGQGQHSKSLASGMQRQAQPADFGRRLVKKTRKDIGIRAKFGREIGLAGLENLTDHPFARLDCRAGKGFEDTAPDGQDEHPGHRVGQENSPTFRPGDFEQAVHKHRQHLIQRFRSAQAGRHFIDHFQLTEAVAGFFEQADVLQRDGGFIAKNRQQLDVSLIVKPGDGAVHVEKTDHLLLDANGDAGIRTNMVGIGQRHPIGMMIWCPN